MMTHVFLTNWFSLGDARTPTGRAILQEQFLVLQRQVPIVLAVLFFSTISAVGYGLAETTHWTFKLAVPTCLLAATVWLMLHWLRLQNTRPTAEQVLLEFRRARNSATLLNLAFGISGLALLQQANVDREAFITVFIFLSAIGCSY